MRSPFTFQIKWYHVLFGFIGLLAALAILAWFFLSKTQVRSFVEDETDIVG
jgi:hypothetical protein